MLNVRQLRRLAFCSLLLLPISAPAQRTPDIPRLSGIVNLADFKRAVFEFARQPCCCDAPRQLLLEEGGDLWGLTLLSVTPAEGAVKVKVEDVQDPFVMRLNAEPTSLPRPRSFLELTNASLLSALELYGDLSGHTLLYWPSLPEDTVSLAYPADNRSEAASILEKAIVQRRVAFIADGKKFTLVVPQEQVSHVRPHAPSSKPDRAENSQAEEIQAGYINFHGADLFQVCVIYARLLGGRFDPSTLPNKPQCFFLQTQSAISKEEAAYALDTLFGWRHIKMSKGQNGTVSAKTLDE